MNFSQNVMDYLHMPMVHYKQNSKMHPHKYGYAILLSLQINPNFISTRYLLFCRLLASIHCNRVKFMSLQFFP